MAPKTINNKKMVSKVMHEKPNKNQKTV